jgi:hypothetical protein
MNPQKGRLGQKKSTLWKLKSEWIKLVTTNLMYAMKLKLSLQEWKLQETS